MTESERKIAAKNVFDLQGIFDSSFAIYGTALGSLREGDVIAHDMDTDLGIFSDDFRWKRVCEAVRAGFEIRSVMGSRWRGMEVSFVRSGVKTDLMLIYRDGSDPQKARNSLWRNGGRNGAADEITHEYDASLFRPIEGRLGEFAIRTLGEGYVRAVYGDDWRVPKEEWDWKNDHLCRKTG